MTSPPAHPLSQLQGIAAVIGAMLYALLSVLLGIARARPRVMLRSELMTTTALEAAEEAACIDITLEPWVEWVAVPAPWRNGRLLPRRHEAGRTAMAPRQGVRLAARGRGPPGHLLAFSGWEPAWPEGDARGLSRALRAAL